MKLFVYGTLLDGGRRVLRSIAGKRGVAIELLGPARTPGHLYDQGYFPAMTAGDGVVHGELFDVPESLIEEVDRFEGTPTHYTREEVAVTLGEGADLRTAWAFAYFIVRQPPADRRIPSGDWLEHLKGKRS